MVTDQRTARSGSLAKAVVDTPRILKKLLSFRTICLVPAILYLILLFGYPAVFNVKLGFEQEDGAQFILHSPVFNGLANYRQLIHDTVFLHALANTAIFGVVTVSLQFVLGFGIALLLNNTSRFYTVLRSALLVPWLLPLIVTGNVWIWMLDGFYGVVNYILVNLHIISHSIAWLSSPTWSLWGVIVANTWLGIPFNVMIIHAGLRAIPDTLYEAAAIDGAGRFRRVTAITLPLLRDVVGVLLLLGVVYSLKLFDVVWVMTKGGPANSSQVLGTLEYQDTCTSNEYGYGAAIANVMLVLSCAFAVLYVYLSRRRQLRETSGTAGGRRRKTGGAPPHEGIGKARPQLTESSEVDIHA